MYIFSVTFSLGGYMVRRKLKRQMFTIGHWMVKGISIGGWYFLLSTCPLSVWWLLRRKSTSTAWQKLRSRFLRVSLCKCGTMTSSHLMTSLVSLTILQLLGFVLQFCFITVFFTLHFLFFLFLFTCTFISSFICTSHFHIPPLMLLLMSHSPTP